jgi:O-antigen/teichoic acid export membrane protein
MLGENAGRQLKWQYFLNIGIGVLGAIYILALGRLLGVSDFGIYTLCLAVPTVTLNLADARLQECMLYFRANHPNRRAYADTAVSLFCYDVGIRAVAAIASIFVALALTYFGYLHLYLDYVLWSAAAVFATKAMSTPAMGVLRGEGELDYFSKAQVADWSVRLLALVILTYSDSLSITTALFSQLLSGGFFNFLIIRRAHKIVFGPLKIKFRQGWAGISSLIRTNRRLIFGSQTISAMDCVVKELDVLICGVFLSSAQIGIYKMAKNFAGIVWRLADPVYILILPRLAALHAAGDLARLNILTKTAAMGLFVTGMFLYVVSVAVMTLIGPLILGPEYLPTIKLFPIASFWIMLTLPLIWTHSMSLAAGRPDIQMWGGAIGNGLGAMAITAGAAGAGVYGATWGLNAAYFLPFLFSFIFLRRKGIVQW